MRLPFLGRRPSRIYHSTQTIGAGHPVPPPPPQPRELIDVVGIGHTETVGGVALTLLSLERYREGQIALFRLHRARGRFEREYPSPHLELSVMPEGTVPYRFWMNGGGGGGMVELEFRQSYVIVPAPPNDASEVVIEVREISWKRYGSGTYKVVSVDTGPWRFTIKH
jgi:hypothetical protein